MSIPSSVFCNCLFFPITDSCSHLASCFYATRKDRAVRTILLAREETPNLCNNSKLSFQGSLLLCSHNQAMCCIYHLKSITFTSGRQKKKKKKKKERKQPVFLKPLSPHFCIGKFTDWFSSESSHCDYAFAGQILGFLCPPKPNKKDRDRIWRK